MRTGRKTVADETWTAKRDRLEQGQALLDASGRVSHSSFGRVWIRLMGETEDNPDQIDRLWLILAAPKLLRRLMELAPDDPLVKEAMGLDLVERPTVVLVEKPKVLA